jgi:hypothetical protein
LGTTGPGTPTAVYTATGVDGNLASDGTSLYFAFNPGFGADQINAVTLTGTGLHTVATAAVGDFAFNNNYGSAQSMFFSSGNLFIVASEPGGLIEVPTSGADADGGATITAIDSTATYIDWVDATEIYYGNSTGLQYATIANLGSPTTVSFPVTLTPGSVSLGGVAVVNGTAYVPVSSNTGIGTYSSQLYKSTAGGAATAVGSTLTGMDVRDIAADSNGAYVIAYNDSTVKGIYGVNLTTGAQTSADTSSNAATAQTEYALDAHNLYFVSGPNSGPYSIIALSR